MTVDRATQSQGSSAPEADSDPLRAAIRRRERGPVLPRLAIAVVVLLVVALGVGVAYRLLFRIEPPLLALQSPPVLSCHNMAVSMDGSTLVAHHDALEVSNWNLRDGVLRGRMTCWPEEVVKSLSLSHDGRYLCHDAGPQVLRPAGGPTQHIYRVFLRDAVTGKEITHFTSDDSPHWYQFTDTAWLTTVWRTGKPTTVLWDLEKQRVRDVIPNFSVYLPMGDRTIVESYRPMGQRHVQIKVWDAASRKIVVDRRVASPLLGASFDVAGEVFALMDDARVTLFDRATGAELGWLDLSSEIQRLSLSPDGQELLIIAAHEVQCWDISSGPAHATLLSQWTTPAEEPIRYAPDVLWKQRLAVFEQQDPKDKGMLVVRVLDFSENPPRTLLTIPAKPWVSPTLAGNWGVSPDGEWLVFNATKSRSISGGALGQLGPQFASLVDSTRTRIWHLPDCRLHYDFHLDRSFTNNWRLGNDRLVFSNPNELRVYRLEK
jgi:hypothetical protein